MTDLVDAARRVLRPRAEHAPAGTHRGTWGEQRRARHPAVVVALVLLVVLVLLAVTAIAVVTRFDWRLDRVPGVFATAADGVRPAPSDVATYVILVTDTAGGSDPAQGTAVDDSGLPAEVVLVAQVADGAGSVAALRPVGDPDAGLTPNEAYRRGGPALLVRTVETLTDLSVDNFLVLDLAGLPEMVDAIGGIRLPVADPDRGAEAGMTLRLVDGEQALAYARGHRGIADGAAARDYRWPTVLRNLTQGMSQELALQPLALIELLDVVGRTAAVDDTLGTAGLWRLLVEAGGLRTEQVTFVSVADTEGAHAPGGDRSALWEAMRAGPLPSDFLERHPEHKLRWRGVS